jgi:hypothetical protein
VRVTLRSFSVYYRGERSSLIAQGEQATRGAAGRSGRWLKSDACACSFVEVSRYALVHDNLSQAEAERIFRQDIMSRAQLESDGGWSIGEAGHNSTSTVPASQLCNLVGG